MKPGSPPSAENGELDAPLLTISEVAVLLGLPPRTVREYLARGELNGQFIRGRWRFRRQDVEDFFGPPSNWGIRVSP